MLQIVPSQEPSSSRPSAVLVKESIAVSAETLMKQKNAERMAEREKRREEREKKRREKEKKRTEKETRKKVKLEINTDMIKRALLLETEGAASLGEVEIVENDEDLPIHWPPIPIVVSNVIKPAGKGILICHGFSELNKQVGIEKKKSVKFADGVHPGEGTSPSGGEELSSPPPQPVKLPKEKRFTKTKKPKKVKLPKKKKIKVNVYFYYFISFVYIYKFYVYL